MSPVEVALIILISIWSIIFVIVGISVFILFRQIKRTFDKLEHIVDTLENFTEDIAAPVGKVIASAAVFKDAFNAIGKMVGGSKSQPKKVQILKKAK